MLLLSDESGGGCNDASVLEAGEAEAWKLAADDLDIAVEVQAEVIVVRDFGSENGMLCAIRSGDGVADLRERAESRSMGWSALGETYARYDRAMFIDMLNDWGWMGDGDPPSWYTGKPWTE